MKELHKLKKYDFETLESFINNSIEESQYIEFKSGEALSKKDAYKKEISKDVSAFANSDGGIIIYGILETNHKANCFSFIDGDEFSKEWLEQIITSTIHRNIPNLKIFPIRKNGNLKETLYVVQIPSSIEAPHMSRDKRFYRRAQFESVIMEEYEVRQLYGRRVKSNLFLQNCKISAVKPRKEHLYNFLFEADVINEGEKPEKEYKVNVIIFNHTGKFTLSWDKGIQNHYYTKLSDSETMISASSNTSIYPNEIANAVRFKLEFSNNNILENLQNIKVEFHLLYSNSKEHFKMDMKDFVNKIDEIDKLFNKT